MLNVIFDSLTTSSVTASAFVICTVISLLMGLVCASCYMHQQKRYTQSMVVTIALLPVMVQVVIMMVNGNIGAGVAVAGAFSLVRFRSVPGSARDIATIFLTMTIGLATGMGYAGISVLITLITCGMSFFYSHFQFGEMKGMEKRLKITIPENLDYTGLFDPLFEKYTNFVEQVRVKTSNMGSMYQIEYIIELKDPTQEKTFLDELRCRNGNLDIICGKVDSGKENL